MEVNLNLAYNMRRYMLIERINVYNNSFKNKLPILTKNYDLIDF